MGKTKTVVLYVTKGSPVLYGGNEYVVISVSDLDKVLAKNLETGKPELLPIHNLLPLEPKEASDTENEVADLELVSEHDWSIARARLEMITPLLGRPAWGSALADQIAERNGVSRATIYNWVQLYRNTGLLSALLPYKPAGGRGKSRLKDADMEEDLATVIDLYYAGQRYSIAETYEELCLLRQGKKIPHLNTLRKRIQWRNEREIFEKRYGAKRASELYDPILGKIQDADWPLAVVQVDHTLLPVIIVDDESRQSIRRAWVTFAIDVYSRVVLGMYLSLDAPSAMSAGLCISHAILPKEKWLADRKFDVDWPCWGVMGTLHMDNAREFRGDMLKVACQEYQIDINLRPVKKPHYGAHIERLMGTVSQKLKRVPGATFSGPNEKGVYDAEGNAIMTLDELEAWLMTFLAKYHHDVHSGIGMPPLAKYREGLLGTKTRPGRGLPARRLDEEKVRIDFMPFFERTVQDYGVLIDDVYYFSDVLRPWINVFDPDNPKEKRQFRFRRDPRDISKLYFFDPHTRRYCAIPYRDLGHPPISIWELRAAKAAAKNDGLKNIDEAAIFRYAAKLRQLEDMAAEKSKVARRQVQRRKHHEQARKRQVKELPTVSKPEPAVVSSPPKLPGIDFTKIKVFTDEH